MNREIEKFKKLPPITKERLEESKKDFQKYYLPLIRKSQENK